MVSRSTLTPNVCQITKNARALEYRITYTDTDHLTGKVYPCGNKSLIWSTPESLMQTIGTKLAGMGFNVAEHGYTYSGKKYNVDGTERGLKPVPLPVAIEVAVGVPSPINEPTAVYDGAIAGTSIISPSPPERPAIMPPEPNLYDGVKLDTMISVPPVPSVYGGAPTTKPTEATTDDKPPRSIITMIFAGLVVVVAFLFAVPWVMRK